MDKMTGKVWVLGDDIDTDIIIPTEYLALKTIDDMKQYGFSAAPGAGRSDQTGEIHHRKEFWPRLPPENRHPEIIKAALGIQCYRKILCKDLLRNSINNGLLLIEQPTSMMTSKRGIPYLL